MKFHRLAAAGMALLLAACSIAWLVTRDSSPLQPTRKAVPAARVSKVDEKPLQTARQRSPARSRRAYR